MIPASRAGEVGDYVSGVPDVESPYFDRIFTPDRYAPEVLEVARALREKGYAVVRFPDDDFDARAERIKAKLAERLAPSLGDGATHWVPRTGRVQDAWAFDEDVKSLAVNPKILDLLGQLYGRRAWPFQTLNFAVGTQQPMHSDMVHFSSMPERFMCGVWVALEDIGPDQGPLEYYPGTHDWPSYNLEQVGYDVRSGLPTQEVFRALWKGLVERHGVRPEHFHARKGDALIWAANLLHGGSRQNDPALTRWSQVTHYYFDDCAYYTPMLSHPLRGQIAFREPLDISTGEVRRNSLNGVEVPRDFVNKARISEDESVPPTLLSRIRRRILASL